MFNVFGMLWMILTWCSMYLVCCGWYLLDVQCIWYVVDDTYLMFNVYGMLWMILTWCSMYLVCCGCWWYSSTINHLTHKAPLMTISNCAAFSKIKKAWYFMKILCWLKITCWQTILMKYHTLFCRKLGKMLQNLSFAAVVIGALRFNIRGIRIWQFQDWHFGTHEPNKV